jgi:hypothetical protein
VTDHILNGCRENVLFEKLTNARRHAYIRIVDMPEHFLHLNRPASGETQHSPNVSTTSEPVGDHNASCISFKITGSGAQPVSKALLKCVLWTLSNPLFSIDTLVPAATSKLIPATRHAGLGVEIDLLTPVYIGSQPKVPASVPGRDLAFKSNSPGMLSSLFP